MHLKREMGIESVHELAVNLFKDLLRVDTTNYGNGEGGNETEAALLIKKIFDEEGISSTIVEKKKGRGNIVARIKSKNPLAGGLLLSAHLDVVPAPEDWKSNGWTAAPFSGEEREDGYIYGRGAIDMKNMAAMSVAVLIAVHRSGVELQRDLIFAGLADEEDGSHLGATFLVEEHPDLVEADIMFTELGGFSYYMENRLFYPVQVAEKGYVNLRIVAHHPGGHSSISHPHSAIGKIGQVCEKLAKERLPMHKCDSVFKFVESMCKALPFPKSYALRQILRPSFHDFVLDKLLPEENSRTMSPMFHNTVNATIIRGGDKCNVVPNRCEIVVNVRTLPGQSTDDCIKEIKNLIGEKRFHVPENGITAREKNVPEEKINALHPSPKDPSDYDFTISVMEENSSLLQDESSPEFAAVFQTLKQSLKKFSPEGEMVPYLCPGGTDAKSYASHPCGMKCFGFSPVHFDNPNVKFQDLFHGTNERVPRKGFLWGLDVLFDAVEDLTVRGGGDLKVKKQDG